MKKKVIGILIIAVMILILLSQAAYGDSTIRGNLIVLDDGKTQEISNDSVKVKYTISSATDKNFTMKVEIENLQSVSTEVALVLDNSFSMWSNEKINTYKEKLIGTVNELFNNVPNLYMSLSTYKEVELQMTANKDEIIQAINNITAYEGITTKTGLKYAKDTFTGKSKNQHIVTFSDTEFASDVDDTINQIRLDSSIKLSAVVIGENATKQVEYKNSTREKVFMIENMESFNFTNMNKSLVDWIKANVKKEINNIEVDTILSDAIRNSFIITLQGNPNIGIINEIENGYKFVATQMNDTKATYTLKFVMNTAVDREYLNSSIKVVGNTKIEYDDSRQEKKILNDNKISPLIKITEQYTLKINIFNKQYKEIKVKNVECKIIQKDLNGNIINDFSGKTFKTDLNGNITIDNLTYEGSSVFEINYVDIPGVYEEKEKESFEIEKNISGVITIVKENLTDKDEEITVDNTNKIINATIYLIPKQIVFNIDKMDSETEDLLPNATYELGLPTSECIPSNIKVTATTDQKGNLKFPAEVAGADNKYYIYTLKETHIPEGYEVENQVIQVKVLFDEKGEISNVTLVNENDKDTAEKSNDVINLKLHNKMKYYTLKIKAVDDEQRTITIPNIEFEVNVIGEDGLIDKRKATTDKNGLIELEMNYRGKVSYTIKQISDHAAYYKAQDTQYTITREFVTNALVLEGGDTEFIQLDNANKVLDVMIPLSPKKIKIKVNKIDAQTKQPLEGVKLELNQPSGRNKIEKTTETDGIVEFVANVVCDEKGGARNYALKELKSISGYKRIKNDIVLNISFGENGKINNAVKNSEYIENITFDEENIEITLLNEKSGTPGSGEDTEGFIVEINKLDSKNDSILIGNTEFKLVQPAVTYINDENQSAIYQESPIEETTAEGEALQIEVNSPVFETVVERTFTYKLIEVKANEKYWGSNLEIEFDVTFNDDGIPISVDNIKEKFKKDADAPISELTTYIKDNIVVENGKIIFKILNEKKDICLNIKAANEIYKNVFIKNVEINTVIKDANGNVVFNQNLITDENGLIKISGLKYDGDFTVDLRVVNIPTGYINGKTKTSSLTRDTNTYIISKIGDTEFDDDVSVNSQEVDIIIYNDVQKFNLDINKLEKLYGNTLIEGSKFTIEQPKIESKSRNSVTKTSVKNEKLSFELEVAGEGTYSYIIKEASQYGYINKNINSTIDITFNQAGEITNVQMGADSATLANQDIVKVNNYTINNVDMTVINEQEPLKLKINVLGKNYSEKISGVDLNILGVQSGNSFLNNTYTTDSNGYIELTDINARGQFSFELLTTKVPTEYIKRNSIILNVDKDWDTTRFSAKFNDGTQNVEIKVDVNTKIIEITIYLEAKTFEIDLNKVDMLNNNIKIAGATFKLIQPNLATGKTRSTITNTTNESGNATFTGEVAGEGTYLYALKESSVPSGYLILEETTKLYITFSKEGNVVGATEQVDSEYVEVGEVNNNRIPIMIENEKKVHSIKVRAFSEDYKTTKVENAKVKLIRKDSKGNQIPFTVSVGDTSTTVNELYGATGSDGSYIFEGLEGSGELIYEIIQENPAPTAFYIGDNKTIMVNIDEVTNDITTEDDSILINNKRREITADIFLEQKKFTITLNKIDYDSRELIGGATITYIEAVNSRTLRDVTKQGEQYVITGLVPGEGTYEFGVNEGYKSGYVGVGIPKGYQNYINNNTISITFDNNGDIVDSAVTLSRWYKYWPSKDRYGNITQGTATYETVDYHTVTKLPDTKPNNVNLELTNVKKQFKLKVNLYNDKYNESVSGVNVRLIVKDEKGNVIYNNIHEVNGGFIIGDIDYFRIEGHVTFEIESLDTISQYEKLNAYAAIDREKCPNQGIKADYLHTSSGITIDIDTIDDEYNIENFTKTVVLNIPMIQKTYDLKVIKVNNQEGEKLLKGANFTLTQPDGRHRQTLTTDENGEAIFSADLYGDNTVYEYRLNEDSAPSGYEAIEKNMIIQVAANNTIVKEIKSDNLNIIEKKIINSSNAMVKVNNKIKVSENPDEPDPPEEELDKLYKIILVEKCDGSPVEGSKYEIKTDALKVIDYTDENGMIRITRLPNQDCFEIIVNQLQNAVGYQKIEGEKLVVAYATPGGEYIDLDRTSDDVIASINASSKTIYIELNTKTKPRINEILFETEDETDEAIKISGVNIAVLKENDSDKKNITTGGNGIAKINIETAPGVGKFTYHASVEGVPNTYETYVGEIEFEVEYDVDGNIIGIQKKSINDKMDVEFIIDDNDNDTTSIAKVILKLKPKEKYKLKVILSQKSQEIIKIDGANYSVKSIVDGNSVTASKTTGVNGEFLIEAPAGNEITINLTETSTPNPYILDSENKIVVLRKDQGVGKSLMKMSSVGSYKVVDDILQEDIKVQILEDGTIEVNLVNDIKKTNVDFEILKVDSEDEAIKLKGVQLVLADIRNDKEYKLTTDSLGQIRLEGFEIDEEGEYDFEIKEITTLDGFILPGEKIKFKIVFEKTDKGLEIKNLIQESDENNEEALIYVNLSYTKKYETEKIIVQVNMVISNVMANRYPIIIYKRDKYTHELLPGALFEIRKVYSEDKEIEAKISTKEDGAARVKMPITDNQNVFKIKELEAPTGYKLDDNEKTIVLNCDSEENITIAGLDGISQDNVIVTNEGMEIYIDDEPYDKQFEFEGIINKTDAATGEAIEGIEFNISEVQENGQTGTKSTVYTNGDGEVSLQFKVKNTGEYIYEIEEKQNANYEPIEKIYLKVILNDMGEVEHAEVINQDKFGDYVYAQIIEGKVYLFVQNKPIYNYKKIIIEKVDAYDINTKLANVVFDIDGEEYITDENGIIEKTTKINGDIDNFATTIIEKQAPSGYVKYVPQIKVKTDLDTSKNIKEANIIEGEKLNDEIFAEIVETTNDYVKIQIKNSKLLVRGRINKFNKVTEETIPGIKFTIAEVVDGEVSNNKAVVVTDGEGKIDFSIFALYEGEHIYEIEEIQNYDYEDIGKIRIKVFVNKNDNVTILEQENQNELNENIELEIIDGIAVINIYNTPVKAFNKIIIEKVDSEDETIKLSDAIFEINEIECVTDEIGIAQLNLGIRNNTKVNNYIISEKKAPVGYQRLQKSANIQVEYDEELKIVSVKMAENNEYAEIIENTQDTITIRIKDVKTECKDYFYFEIYKYEKETLKRMSDVMFAIKGIEFNTQQIISEEISLATDEEGKIAIKIGEIEPNSQYEYVLKESTPNNYKDIDEIKVLVTTNEIGEVENVKLINENAAVNNLFVEDGIVRLVVLNELKPVVTPTPTPTPIKYQPKKDTTVVQNILPQTGEQIILGAMVLISFMTSLVLFIKYKKTK